MKRFFQCLVRSIILLVICLHVVGNSNASLPVHALIAPTTSTPGPGREPRPPVGFCRIGKRTAILSHGTLTKTFLGVLIYSVHGTGKVLGPEDNDVYSLVIQDFGNTIYTNRDIRVGSPVSINYTTPWWKPGVVNIRIVFKCITHPNKTVKMIFYGSGCVN